MSVSDKSGEGIEIVGAISQAESVSSQHGGFVGFGSSRDHVPLCGTTSCNLLSVIRRQSQRVEAGSLSHWARTPSQLTSRVLHCPGRPDKHPAGTSESRVALSITRNTLFLTVREELSTGREWLTTVPGRLNTVREKLCTGAKWFSTGAERLSTGAE